MSLSNFRPYEIGSCIREETSLKLTSSADYAVIAIATFFCLFNGFMVAIMFVNRKFGPIAAKQPNLLILQYFGGVFWIIGNMMVNDTISLPQSVQSYGIFCFMRRFWIAYLFGFSAWIASFITRFLRLYIVIIMAKKPHAPIFYVVLFQLPLFLFCFIGLFLEGDRSCLWVVGAANQTSNDHLELPGNGTSAGEGEGFAIIRCSCSDAFAYIAAAIHIVYILISFYFIFVLRNIRSSFNEYREMRLQIFSAVAIYIVGVALSMARVDNYITGRSALSLLYVLAVTLVQGLTLFIPIYKTLFAREAFDVEFKSQLRRDADKHVESYTNSKKTHPLSPKKEIDSETGKGLKKESQISLSSNNSTSFQKRERGSEGGGRDSSYSLNDESWEIEMEEKEIKKEEEKDKKKSTKKEQKENEKKEQEKMEKEKKEKKEKEKEKEKKENEKKEQEKMEKEKKEKEKKEKEKRNNSGRVHQPIGKNFSIIFEENSTPHLAVEMRDQPLQV